MPSISDLCTSALTEIRVARAGDTVSPENMALALYLLNRLLDQWNANRRAVYNEGFTDFTLTPNHTPHTIGPSGDFAVTQRPQSIEAVSLNLGSVSQPIFRTVNVRDDAWYQQQTIPAMTNSVPTDCYYSRDWPLGNLYFWGVPTTAYGVRIWMRTLLTAVALTDDFALPPGYQAALELTLAETCASSFGQPVAPTTVVNAKNARALIFGDNDETPRLATRDSGMPSSGSGGSFNWLNRTIS